jgi:DNA-binding protein
LDEEDEAVEEVKITKDDKVVKKHEEMAENEIKITSKGLIKNYLGYAFRILNKTNHRNLKIRATGNAIVKALILIELVKRRVPELHQLNKIYSMELKSTKEPKI